MWLFRKDKDRLEKLIKAVHVLEFEKQCRDSQTHHEAIDRTIRTVVKDYVKDDEVAEQLIRKLRLQLSGYFKQVF